MSGPFTNTQPKDGDGVLHCGHLDKPRNHFFGIEGPGDGMPYERPDGSEGAARWIIACQSCFDAAGGDWQKVAIKGDGLWDGDEPIIKQNVECN